MSALDSWKNDSRSGASAPSSISVGESSRAAGRSCVTSGSVSRANWSRRSTVCRDSRSNVGSAMNVSCSSRSRAAVVSNTRLEFSIRSRSWPSRSVSASKTMPVSLISRCTAGSWRSRMSTSSAASSANGPRLPSASLMSRPCPSNASACDCIQTWNAWRVSGSNVRRISSSSTVSETWPSASRPPSGSVGAELVPGVSST